MLSRNVMITSLSRLRAILLFLSNARYLLRRQRYLMFTHVPQIHERNVNPRRINTVYGQVQRVNLRTQVAVVSRQCIPLILCIYGFLAKQRSRTKSVTFRTSICMHMWLKCWQLFMARITSFSIWRWIGRGNGDR